MSILKKKIREIEKKIFVQTPRTLFKNKEKKFDFQEIKLDDKFKAYKTSFGNLNPDKIFYIIRRSPGAGIFSNVLYVLNHLNLAKKNNFIPIVDMKNYITIYNEKNSINNNYNAWEYYFNNFSNHSLDEVYKSKNVLLSDNVFYKEFTRWLTKDYYLIDLLKKEITIKNNLYKICNVIKKKYFVNKIILGIHFRGTTYKYSPDHPFAATKVQIKKKIDEILKKNKIDLIFLSTEEKRYAKFLKKKYKNLVFYFSSSYRSNINDAFDVYPRKRHRYKLGKEILLETLLLSSCDHFIYTESNVSEFAISWNDNSKQKRHHIDNGFNSNSKFIASWLWYYKSIMPRFLGGF